MKPKICGINLYTHVCDYEEGGETKFDQITFIDFREVPEEWKEEFGDWLRGQTFPMIEGFGINAIYSWDWERWYNLKTRNIPTYFD